MSNIKLILKTITSPNSCFQKICEKNEYLNSAIVLFVITAIVNPAELILFNDYLMLQTGDDTYYVDIEIRLAWIATQSLMGMISILAIFFFSKKLGGNNSFKDTFTVLSYTLIPVIFGGLIQNTFVFYPWSEYVTVSENHLPWGIFSHFLIFTFGIWSLVITIKGIKILNKFGTAKSFGILILGGVSVLVFQLFVINPAWEQFLVPYIDS